MSVMSDTGTEYTVLSNEVVKQLKLMIDDSIKANISAIFGGNQRARGVVHLSFDFNGRRVQLIDWNTIGSGESSDMVQRCDHKRED